jgi:DNA gyrase subunit A
MDGDPPAAMRYTESRLNKAAEALLEDIDKDTVNFRPNYDESTKEPEVHAGAHPQPAGERRGRYRRRHGHEHPAAQSGRSGRWLLRLHRQSDISTDELIDIIPGPDFPTGAQILGRNGIRSAYHTGNGSVMMRAKTSIEEKSAAANPSSSTKSRIR